MNNQHLNEKKTRLSVDYFEKMHIIKNRKEDEVAIMLIQFNFKNFRSFREEVTLDLSATKMTEFSERVVTIGRGVKRYCRLLLFMEQTQVASQIYTVHLSIWLSM